MKGKNCFLIVSVIAMLNGSPAQADDKEAVAAAIDQTYERNREIALKIFDYAEVGYQETRSSALLQQTLADSGFEIDSGVAGIPTAFVASAGNGGPVVAFLAEFDALPGISQIVAPYRQLAENKTAGHACGHHLLGTGSVAAAIAVREWLQRTGTKGTIRVYGTPAEEGGSGKVYMVRAGLFDDVDGVLSWHPSDHNGADANSNLANRSARFRFRGISAHAAGAPEKARSALDGVEVFNYMVNLMREHVPQETRIHYVITDGGKAPNVVPDFAEVYYYVRHPDARTLQELWQRVEKAAHAAADGTETHVESEIMHGNHSLLPNKTLTGLMQENLGRVGGVQYSTAERSFAESLYETLNNPDYTLGSESEIQPPKSKMHMGSTDVGDISWNVPTAGLRAATWVPGTSAHSWQAIASGGTEIGIKGLQVAAKVLAMTAMDLYLESAHLDAARQELLESRGDDFQYVPLLGDRDPPLDYRK